MDGMGTANRSKAFHDVCWHDLKDAGFPDRILWHQAVGKKYPVLRPGAGWESTARRPAARTRPAACCSIPSSTRWPPRPAAATTTGWTRLRGTSSGWAIRSAPWYAASSNVDNAHRLQGKLLLIVGEMDTNVPARIDDAAGRCADQGRQGFRSRRRSQRQSRHGRRLRPAPAARFLRSPPAWVASRTLRGTVQPAVARGGFARLTCEPG